MSSLLGVPWVYRSLPLPLSDGGGAAGFHGSPFAIAGSRAGGDMYVFGGARKAHARVYLHEGRPAHLHTASATRTYVCILFTREQDAERSSVVSSFIYGFV